MQETNTVESEPIDLQAFDYLQAEDEPWLSDTFEKPAEFDLICRPRSSLIFGDSGSGKTAIHKSLKQSLIFTTSGSKQLMVEWRTRALRPEEEMGSEVVEKQVLHILDNCASTLLEYLASTPQDFQQAPEWAQSYLVWYIQTYLQGNLRSRTRRLHSSTPEKGRSLLEQLYAWEEITDAPLGPEPDQEDVITELIFALKDIQIEGIWILVDGLETRSNVEPEKLANALKAFLSTLNLLEQQNFVFKFFLPTTLKPYLSGVSGVQRRRLGVHNLHWSVEKLIALALRRINFALGMEFTSLGEICEDQNLATWLERCGGENPRGWLESIRPLVAAYLEQGQQGSSRPITEDEWKVIRRNHPPILMLDQETGSIQVGDRMITELTEQQQNILSFMYDRPGEICTRSQLHYLADMKLSHEPRTHTDEMWEPSTSYSGKLDTAIWRLRQLLEPDPTDKKPLFIITEKGKGYRLENAWH